MGAQHSYKHELAPSLSSAQSKQLAALRPARAEPNSVLLSPSFVHSFARSLARSLSLALAAVSQTRLLGAHTDTRTDTHARSLAPIGQSYAVEWNRVEPRTLSLAWYSRTLVGLRVAFELELGGGKGARASAAGTMGARSRTRAAALQPPPPRELRTHKGRLGIETAAASPSVCPPGSPL